MASHGRRVAIVGVATELPSGTFSDKNLDHESFYRFLLHKGEGYCKIPSDRFNVDAWHGHGPGQVHVRTGAFLKDIDLFDNVEFGISSADAQSMAPVTRKLIECCFLALRDSGVEFRAKNVGCFVSGNSIDITSVADFDEYSVHAPFASAPAMIANRVSAHLDLLGPSLAVDTACSSTMTAMHLAVNAIVQDECNTAVVAGCQMNHRFKDWIMYSQGSVLSPDGKCKPFDANANGFSRGEGCAAVVLRDLNLALKANDRIYGVVLGSAINSGGSGGPPGAPVAEAQQIAMKKAFQVAGCDPKNVDYIELHATGTRKGDPAEVNWVGNVFNRSEELVIGSVKGNIGHTEIVSFLASLSKVLSIIEHRRIPPNVNFNTPNPTITWDKYNLRVPLVSCDLTRRNGQTSIIAITSSGIGGTNGHIVIESPDALPLKYRSCSGTDKQPRLLMAGGLSPRSAELIARGIEDYTSKDFSDLELAVFSTVLGRQAKQTTYRSYVIADPDGNVPVLFSSSIRCPRIANPIVFVFSGQGPQHKDMGRQLFQRFPVFRNSILEMDTTFQRLTQISLLHDYGLFHGSRPNLPLIWPISLILPSITIFQIALFDLLVSLGIKPDIVVGHSAGETAGSYASGALSKDMAVELSIIRGLSFSTIESIGGTMGALSCSPEDAQKILAEVCQTLPDQILEIACFNSPTAVAISGHESAIKLAIELAESKGIFARKIRTSVPIHSSLMDHCLPIYVSKLEDLFSRFPGDHKPQITTFSTLTGAAFTDTIDATYFWNNTRSQVKFTHSIEAMTSEFSDLTFVELSPHPVLSSYISSMVTDKSVVLATARRPKDRISEEMDILHLCGKLTSCGHNCVDFTFLNQVACYSVPISLPPYPFAKVKFPLYPTSSERDKQMESRFGPINHRYLKINKDTHPILSEHVIRSEPIMPAAGFMEMAIEFGASILMNVRMCSIFSLSAKNPVEVKVLLDGAQWSVSSLARTQHQNEEVTTSERLHAEGYLSFDNPPNAQRLCLKDIKERCSSQISADFYDELEYFSSYGPRFQRVTNMYYNDKEALLSLRGMDDILAEDGNYILHPAILDSCIQICGQRRFHGNLCPNTYYLPAFLRSLIAHKSHRLKYFPCVVYAHVVLLDWKIEKMTYDIILTDVQGDVLVSLEGLVVEKHYINSLASEPLTPWEISLQPVYHKMIQHERRPSFIGDTMSGVQSWCCRPENLEERIASILWLESIKALRVIRIAIISNTDLFVNALMRYVDGSPSFYYEIFIAEDNMKIPLSTIHPDIGIIRRVNQSQLSEFSNGASFNLIFTEMPDNYHVDKFSFLLAPGGFWIFTTNRSSAEFETGQEICNYIDASLKARSTFSNLFDIAEHFAFHYAYGSEKYIQWEFSGLNPNQDLDIWLLAADGRDSNALLGLARCLRREYMRWTLRTVAFPAEINLGERVEILSSFSSSLKRETDFVYCKDGQLLVPRMVPIPKLKAPFPSAPRVLNMQDPPANHTQIQLVTSSASTNGSLFGFWGRVCHDVRGFKADLIVAGLSSGPLDRLATVDSGTIAPVPCFQGSAMVDADQLAGMAIAVLAPGRNSFLQSRTSQSIVLVTHADSNIGRGIQELYRLHRVPKLICVPSGVTLMELATKGYQNFDLIISGYEYASGLPFIQLLHSLLKPMAGKLFLWNHPTSGVPGILSQDPCAIGDALSIAFELVATFQRSEDLVFDYWDRRASLSPEICSLHSPEAQFSPDKFYILIGGFGSLGVHIARFMYQRGARRIVLTSRRGNFKNKILAVGRMTKCLENLKDLNLSISAVDGSSTEQMTSFFNTFSLGSVGGCIVLTAVLRDKVFASLTTDDFNATFDGKSGVFDALARSTDVSQFDFLIAFTSVSGAFGNQGQANYAAANTALENDVGSLDNGFSFICPGIIDSALMSANSDSGQLSEWSFTSEQMLLSLNDAIYRQQMGQKLTRYIPCLDWGSLDRNIGMHVLGKHLVPEDQAKPQVTSTDNVCEEISRIVQEVLEIPKSDFRTDIPFTAYGIDSLSASRLSFALRSFISISQIQLLADICLNDLYNQLSDVEVAISTETISGPFDGLNGMIEMLSKYTQKSFTRMIGTVSSDADQDKPSTEVVLLTGSMGSLGTEILAQLLVNPEIAGVFAFNRPPPSGSSLERQRMSFILHGHEASLVESPKLVLIEGDFGAKDLGLRIETVGQLKKNVTHIIHAAWAVNFAMPLSGFEDLVKGTQTLMQLAAQSEQSASLSFSYISSVGILQQPKDTSILQEKILSDPEVSLSSGYSSSKWVAEKLVAGNAQTFGLNVNILRVGLIAGSSNGYWDKSHWFPAIVQTAEYLGCLPDGEDHVSWVTCEVASKSIIELRKTSTSQQVLNLVHPRPVKWNDLITVLAECLNVPIVPFAEWFGRLEGSARDDASRPFEKRQGEFRGAYKLLDLFRRGLDPSVNFESMGFLPMASNEMACSLSLTLRNAPSLSRNNVLQWVKSWKEVGVLNAE